MSCCQDLGQVLINDLLHRVLVISSIHTKCRNMESLLIMSHNIWLPFTIVWRLRWYLKNYGKYERVFQLDFLDLPIRIKKPRIDSDKNNFANTRIVFIFSLMLCLAFGLLIVIQDTSAYLPSINILKRLILFIFGIRGVQNHVNSQMYLRSTFLLFELTILVHFEEEKCRPNTSGPKLRTNSNTWSWIAQILFWTKI